MRIGDRLISAGLINEAKLEQALIEQERLRGEKKRKKIVRILVDLGFLEESNLLSFFIEQCKNGALNLNSIIEDFPASEDSILHSIASHMDMLFIDLYSTKVDKKVVEYIPFVHIKKFYAFPFKEDEDFVYVAIIDPFNPILKESFSKIIRKKPIKYCLAKKDIFARTLDKLELNDGIKELVFKVRKEIKGDSNTEGESAIAKLIDIIFITAIKNRASDIHIESNEENWIVRCRVDGILYEYFEFEKDIFPPLSSKIKLTSEMDISERRKPQDGRFSAGYLDGEYDFRVSSLPIVTGESIVIRILDKTKVLMKLEDLGMSEVNLKRFSSAIKTPYGIIFVTGPTGSGKTTTLYATLNAIKSVSEKIITVEDPVEYRMDDVHQVMVNEKVNLTFSNALRSILRQDPDKIMIGEIRDQETLKIAIQAALTGHLVISTLHTNDALSGITRLLDMGLESFFIGSAMVAIQAQRLVRKLCIHCKYEAELPQNIIDELFNYLPKGYAFYKSHGCPICNMTGYSGRELICEVILGSEQLKKLIAEGASKDLLLKTAKEDGFVTMFEDGLSRALEGLTSIEEVYRVAKLPA